MNASGEWDVNSAQLSLCRVGMTRQSDSSIVFRWKKTVKFARALHRDSVPLMSKEKSTGRDAVRFGGNFRQHLKYYLWQFAFVSKSRWNFSLIFQIYLRNVGKISSDIFVSVCKYRWYYAFSSETSVELSINNLHLFAKCLWKFP